MDITEKPTLQKSKIFKQYLISICVCLGALCTGTVLSWTSPVLPQLIEQNIITQNEEGIIGSILSLGALLGSIPSGYLADIIGRKKTLIITSVLFITSWTLIVAIKSVVAIYVARFLLGVCGASACVCIPMYIGEIAETSIRGTLGAFLQIFINIGILSTAIFNLFLNWEWLSAALGFWTILFGFTALIIPETPTYLLKIGENDRARKILTSLRGENYSGLEKELQDTYLIIEETKEQKFNFKKSISSRANRRALIAGMGLLAFQQLCGVTAITFYTATIFKAAGSAISPDIATLIVNATQATTACLPLFLVERATRKFYLKVSGIGIAICLAVLGIYFHLIAYDVRLQVLNTLPLISLVLYILFFCIGFGSFPWIIIGEIYSSEIKALGTGLALVSCWSSVFIVTFTFPLITDNLGGHVAFYIYAGVSIVGTFFVQFFVPETKGRTLQEIQKILDR